MHVRTDALIYELYGLIGEIGIVESEKIKVFISYAREDFEAAHRLYHDLRAAGLDPWLDKESIRPGEDWRLAIQRGVKESRFFLALLSSTSVAKRGTVQKEFKLALDTLDEFPEGEIFVIPLRLDECEPTYERLCNLQWADMFPDWQEGLRRILWTILGDDQKDDSELVISIESDHAELKRGTIRGRVDGLVAHDKYAILIYGQLQESQVLTTRAPLFSKQLISISSSGTWAASNLSIDSTISHLFVFLFDRKYSIDRKGMKYYYQEIRLRPDGTIYRANRQVGIGESFPLRTHIRVKVWPSQAESRKGVLNDRAGTN
jgi:hypothetical protein